MISSNALDNVIAVVVVILLLSLIVQSIQAVLKKAFKIKSRQIEDSLVDLFENVLHYDDESASASKGTMRGWLIRISGSSPILRRVYEFISRSLHPSDPYAHPDTEVKKLFDEVTRGFQQVGRVAQTGKQMLDSVSKDDLKKVMGKVLPNSLLPGFSNKLEQACAYIKGLDEAIKEINDNYLGQLSGDASAKFAAMQQSLAPLLNDLRSVFSGQQVSSSVLIGDILNLRDIKFSDALKSLGEIQQKVEEDLEAANKAKAEGDAEAAGRATALTALSAALSKIAQALTKLNEGLDAAITPLRTKLSEVETWYDTVMQSFEERYTRGMKTWAIVISFLVVAYLNANVFVIYKSVATNDALRAQLVQRGEDLTKKKNEIGQANKEPAAQQSSAAQPTVEEIDKEIEAVHKQIGDYSSLGFQPMTWQDVKNRLNPTRWTKIDQSWFDRRKEDFKTLFGWLVMTLLLSVGAPFWQDTLESLFGVKNLLRGKSNTKNVEAESGAGQPKP